MIRDFFCLFRAVFSAQWIIDALNRLEAQLRDEEEMTP